MHTTKKSNDRKIDGSAAVIARTIIRLLRENGFPKAEIIHSYYTSEGFTVSRAGDSNTIHVDYHTLATRWPRNDHARRWSKIAQMREVLFELGYISSQPRTIYIDCTRR